MKKIRNLGFILLIVAVLVTGCGKKKETEANLTLGVEEIIEKVYDGLDKDDMPALGNVEITKENMSYYLGVENLDIKEGYASEPMIGSIPWSIVVIKVNDGVDIEQAKKDIKEKVNPAKWICVDAEVVLVENKGNTIILIMMDEENKDKAETIQKNFLNLK